MNGQGTIYTSTTKYVDIDTGEQLRTETATNKSRYIILKTTKKITYNANKSRGYVEYCNICSKQPQLEINFD